MILYMAIKGDNNMKIDNLRYTLTDHKVSHSLFSSYVNEMLLVHPLVDDKYLLNVIEDDISLLPKIKSTIDNVNVEFYRYNYNKEIYSKSELLAFIYASINKDWDIIKGVNKTTLKPHYWLRHNDIIFDPSLAIITKEEIYSKEYKKINELKNKDVRTYLKEYNNLYKFYNKDNLLNTKPRKDNIFSIDFINGIIKEFNENIEKQYILDEEKMNHIKRFYGNNNFLEFRQVLSQKRTSFLKSNKIAVYPSIDESILEKIEKDAKVIKNLMEKEYDIYADYYDGTQGNCYALSILFNLYNGDFKLVQGGIPYRKDCFQYVDSKVLWQHSWLEKDDIIYDPALRLITTKDLYYIFVVKQDEYTKEETEDMLRRIGINFTHFRDFIAGKQIGNDETTRYRTLINFIDSEENKKEGERLISQIKALKR